MKIFIDARWTRTDFHDGISRYGAGIVQGFIENNIPATLIIKDEKQLKMLPQGLPHIMMNEPLSVKELFLPFKLNRMGADVVYTPFQIIGSWGRKYKLVVTLHDVIYYLHPTAPNYIPFSQRIVWRLFHMAKWPQKMLLNNADAVATVSNYSKKNIHDMHLTDRDIYVAYNAPSLDPSQIGKKGKKTKDILYMGNFMPFKNVEVLIKGMALLPHDFTLHLLTKITDERKAELSKLIQPGVKVVFHNGTPDDEYYELLQNAYCLATGSKAEGFGLPIVESQILETPVVCADTVIFHEVAGDGALYFDPDQPQQFADCVKSLSDKATCDELIKNGKQQASQFTWKKSATKLYTLFEKLCAK